MKTHILIFSIVRDLPYLDYCLRSIKKFATRFSGVTICVPVKEREEFFKGVAAWPEQSGTELHSIVKFYDAPEDREKWHIAHQAEKCRADLYVPSDTDLVLFMDSDCIFTESVTPDDYIVDKKPELLIKEFSKSVGDPWRQPTEEILKEPCLYSTMTRHPALHWTIMFLELRAHVEKLHGRPFVDYILTRKPTFPWGVSDFNLMGSYVLNSDWKKDYHIIDVGVQPQPSSSKKLFQFWSLSPVDKPQGTPNTGDYLVPLEKCKSIGL